MSNDKFGGMDHVDFSARQAVALTLSDDATLANIPKAIYVGATGNLKVTMVGDTDTTPVTFVGVPAGAILPIRIVKAWATGSTASSVLSLY